MIWRITFRRVVLFFAIFVLYLKISIYVYTIYGRGGLENEVFRKENRMENRQWVGEPDFANYVERKILKKNDNKRQNNVADAAFTIRNFYTAESKSRTTYKEIDASKQQIIADKKFTKRKPTTTLVPSSKTHISPELGKVNCYTFRDVCTDYDNFNLYWNPLFPTLPHRHYFITKLQDDDWMRETIAKRMLGYLHIYTSGYYSFEIQAKGGVEVILFDKQIDAKNVLLNFALTKSAMLKQNITNFRQYRIESKEIYLERGRRYPFEVATTCYFFGRYSLKFKKRDDVEFMSIDGKHISPYLGSRHRSSPVPPSLLSNKKSKQKILHEGDKRIQFAKRIQLSAKTCKTGLKTCAYTPSYLFWEKKLKLFWGQGYVTKNRIYPDDHIINMDKKNQLRRLLDDRTAEDVAKGVFKAINNENNGIYELQNIVHVEENDEGLHGKRYFVELDLKNTKDGKSYRFSDYLLRRKEDKKLYIPEGYDWQSDVMIYLICAVKNQRQWFNYLVDSIEKIIERTKDQHLHLVVVDFHSQDSNVKRVLQESKLNYTFLQMTGNFSKVRALNEGVRRVPDNNSLVFIMDLQLQLPDHIFDQSRKHTVQGKMTYCPVLMRLQCGEHPEYTKLKDSRWMDIGYGMMVLYKTDWDKIGGMNEEMFKYKWGGEDWEFVDRVMLARYELVHERLPGFYHIYHSTLGTWDGTKLF